MKIRYKQLFNEIKIHFSIDLYKYGLLLLH